MILHTLYAVRMYSASAARYGKQSRAQMSYQTTLRAKTPGAQPTADSSCYGTAYVIEFDHTVSCYFYAMSC